MKSDRNLRLGETQFGKTAWVALWASFAMLSPLSRAEAAPNVTLWDTVSPLADSPNLEARTGWKAVPSDLLTLEADPPKASSDPGYFGREYAFKGDAVVENRHFVAVFSSAKGRVAIYAGAEANRGSSPAQPPMRPGGKIVEFVPLQAQALPGTLSRLEVLRNAEDEVALKAAFSAQGSADCAGIFSFDKTEIIGIKPAENLKGLSLLGPIEHGIVPSFIGDDLIFNAADYPAASTLCLPAENFFLGLLAGGDRELVLTWPKGKQQLKLQLGSAQKARLISSIDFENDGQSLYLAVLSAPGLWHRQILDASFLEKDVTIPWKRPFPARWKTQLVEEGTKASFAFRPAKGQVWRGVAGSYSYPVWFKGNEACYHLSKKVAPKGQSLIYFLEGQETPPSVTTPADILKATLGRSASEAILDIAGRKLRTHHRRGGEGVRRACTCGCTEAIQAVFEAGEESTKQPYIEDALGDMIYFVRRHVERIDEYKRFAEGVLKFLQAQRGAAPELQPFLENLEEIARAIPQECTVQQDNMKSLGYADDLAKQTLALANRKAPNNLKAYMELLKAWRAMGGAQDYVVALCHVTARKLCQEAGYGCVTQPKAVAAAEEIRARCRQCLRNPDGYEIWADY